MAVNRTEPRNAKIIENILASCLITHPLPQNRPSRPFLAPARVGWRQLAGIRGFMGRVRAKKNRPAAGKFPGRGEGGAVSGPSRSAFRVRPVPSAHRISPACPTEQMGSGDGGGDSQCGLCCIVAFRPVHRWLLVFGCPWADAAPPLTLFPHGRTYFFCPPFSVRTNSCGRPMLSRTAANWRTAGFGSATRPARAAIFRQAPGLAVCP